MDKISGYHHSTFDCFLKNWGIGMVGQLYSHQEHLLTKPNDSKCIRYGRIGPRLCKKVNQERIREVGGVRAAIEAGET